MIIVSSWEGNAHISGCYLWERSGVRRWSVVWKQSESVVGGVNLFSSTTHISWKVRVRQFWNSFSWTVRQYIQPSSSIDTIIEFLTNTVYLRQFRCLPLGAIVGWTSHSCNLFPYKSFACYIYTVFSFSHVDRFKLFSNDIICVSTYSLYILQLLISFVTYSGVGIGQSV